MDRRTLLLGVGSGTTALVSSCSRLVDRTATPDHLVQIANGRETAHDAFVELDFEGETDEYGPRTIEPGASWTVRRVESRGELTVRVFVDEKLVWSDTHEIPTPGRDRRSFAQVELLPDGDVLARVKRED